MTGKKKGKKGKGKKEKKPGDATDKLAAVDRTFYELTITDLNNKLVRLRTHNSRLEEMNEELTDKLRKLEEDRTDVAAHLDRKLAEQKDANREMTEQLLQLSKVRDQESKQAADKIRDWEQRYKATQEQLSSEIKLLNGKLNSLEEFRLQKDEILAKFHQQELKLQEQENRHKEVLYEMEKKIVLDKALLKQEVQNRLFQLSDEFHKSGEVRMAAYTQRLVRENIALNSEMDKMVASQAKIDEHHREVMRQAEVLKQERQTDEAIKAHLIRTCQTQVTLIGSLTEELETVKAKYEKIKQYKKLYEDTLTRNSCERFRLNDIEKRLTVTQQKLDALKVEKARLGDLHKIHESEIDRLRNIIKHIKYTVQTALRNERDEPFSKTQRQGLLSEVIKIITTYADAMKAPTVTTVTSVSSKYRAGSAGLVPPRSTSLLQLFRREARKIASAEKVAPDLGQKTCESHIVPVSRKVESENVFDVQAGATYVVSEECDDTENGEEDVRRSSAVE